MRLTGSPFDIAELRQTAGQLMRAAATLERGSALPKRPRIDILNEHAAECSPEALRGPCRAQKLFKPRAKAMLAMRREGYSFPQIGQFFHRDHTSVMHACKKAMLWERLNDSVR